MKKFENIGEEDMLARIVFGVMLFIFFWFQMLGHISIELPAFANWIILVLSVSLLLTGSAKVSPIYTILGISTKRKK